MKEIIRLLVNEEICLRNTCLANLSKEEVSNITARHILQNSHRGDVGLKEGLVGEYLGDVGLNDGDWGLYLGDVGENEGDVGE